MNSDDASSSETETEQTQQQTPSRSKQFHIDNSPPSHDEDSHEDAQNTTHHVQPHHRSHLSHQHRASSSSKLSRHHAKPLGARVTSFGKNLNKLATQQQHEILAAQAAATQQSTKPAYRRSVSNSLTSPTSTSPRPSLAVRRNASAYAIARAAPSSALKKNHSSGHLPRHATSKNPGKVGGGRGGPPPMKRTQSSKSHTQKSPIEPPAQQHHTVRFDMGDDLAPGDEEDDDNAWTEDSTSVSPVTTRDHTRHNSIILDPNNALRIGQSSNTAPSHSSPLAACAQTQKDQKAEADATSRPESTTIKRSSSSHNIPTADAITSRLLMRAPAQNPTVSNIAATAIHSATPPGNSSNSDSYTMVEQNSVDSASGVGSAGSHLIGRFINGGGSQGTPLDIRAARMLDAHDLDDTQGSPTSGKGKEKILLSKSLDSHRRNKSLSNVVNAKANSRNHVSSSNLPPSRTQQKLELQRASSVLETTKHVIPVLPKPSAPAILRSGVNIGFGFTDGEHYQAQIHSLFSSITKEYMVVRRYRQPIADSFYRIDAHSTAPSSKRKGKAKSLDPARNHSDTLHRSRHRKMEDNDSLHSSTVPSFHYTKPARTNTLHPDPEGSSPEKHSKRKNRVVSFEIAPQTFVSAGDAEADDEDDDSQDHPHRPESEVAELCRRMWELNSIPSGALG